MHHKSQCIYMLDFGRAHEPLSSEQEQMLTKHCKIFKTKFTKFIQVKNKKKAPLI